MSPNQKYITIRGAREHNLKNINLKLPRDQFIIITGLSGSGKSSLAFDTIYAEGQRRYVESLSAYARQFLELMSKPDVDQIEGLSPAIAIEQKTTNRNPRSTVGTVTEIYDYLRLLFARIGTAYSPLTGLPIEKQNISQMVDKILSLKEGTRLYILAPIIRGRKGEHKKEIKNLQQKGYQRLRVNGVLYEIEDLPPLDKNCKHDIDVVIDRLIVKADSKNRLADSLETALNLADGLAIAQYSEAIKQEGQINGKNHSTKPDEQASTDQEKLCEIMFSQKFACPISGFTISEIEPRLFSFNSPFGACPTCDGLGYQQHIDANLLIGDKDLPPAAEGFFPWPYRFSCQETIKEMAKYYGFSLELPWSQLDNTIQNIILYGNHKKTGRSFMGIIPYLEKQYRSQPNSDYAQELERYMRSTPCQSCKGFRLKKEALTVKISDLHIGEIAAMSIEKAQIWIDNLLQNLSPKKNLIAQPIVKEISSRLNFLNDVGLNYLTLARNAQTLSGGEGQRIRLASQIGSGLVGVLYVLDEPSIGLHQRDNARLLASLKKLRDLGNSVLVVEHDEDAIRAADYIVDLGPGAGVHGGSIVAQGSLQDIMQHEASLTGQYLAQKRQIARRQPQRPINNKAMLHISGANANNLKNISADIPLGNFTCITGVSGSGKSSFLIETLFKAAAQQLMGAKTEPGPYKKISGLQQLDKVINISQSPIGRTPRSNPATYVGLFTPIRNWFSLLPEAKARGYKPGRFSFNVKGGRCETCQGDGLIKIEMHFLADIYVPCDMCQGKRYNRETLEITFRDKNIADILDLTVGEAAAFFSNIPAIYNKLQALERVGLDYIRLGQAATTLSGGEAQRIKLAKELAKKATGKTLYILDEPTTGLHFHDIAKLLDILHELVDQGNSVILIEHNLDVIKTADWIIDFGPEGGDKGGKIIAKGPVADIIKQSHSYTGQFLKKLLASQASP